MKHINRVFVIILLFIFGNGMVFAQNQMLGGTQQFRLGDRFIRVAEPGELTDSVNVWGDFGTSGRFLVPKNTSLVELISYSGGLETIRSGQTQLDWSKMRVEIYVQELGDDKKTRKIASFRFRLEEQYPDEMWNFMLSNNQIVTARVKRRPSFVDYLGVFASTISAIAGTVILLDRLKN